MRLSIIYDGGWIMIITSIVSKQKTDLELNLRFLNKGYKKQRE